VTADEYLAALAETGWLNDLSDEDRSQLRSRVEAWSRQEPSCPAWGLPAARRSRSAQPAAPALVNDEP
jgi:hypothetical protein